MASFISKPYLSLFCAFWLAFFSGCSGFCDEAAPPKPDFGLDEKTAATLAAKVDELVTKKFIFVDKIEKSWRPAYNAAHQSLVTQTDLLSFAGKMNEILSSLKVSHTQFLTENDEMFFFLRSLFGANRKEDKDKNSADFTGLGVGGAHALPGQVRYVLDGSPAAKAGFKRGDKINSVDGRTYSGYAVWYQSSGHPCQVWVERQGKPLKLTITPVKQDFLKGYRTATEESARVITNAGRKIGYVHFWSGGEGTHESLENAVQSTLISTDALVLDLRDGYGAASLNDLDAFFRPRAAFPDMRSWDRQKTYYNRSYYDKPMAVLINKGTRSGKELLSFGFKRSKRAVLIGDNTAGYVVGGEYIPLDKRAILYLAVQEIQLDGEDLEGKGVTPNIPVADTLGPEDPVLQRALGYLSSHLTRPAVAGKKVKTRK
jgi:carboxyl-terminal processing protease